MKYQFRQHCTLLLITAGLLLTASRAHGQEIQKSQIQWRASYNEARQEAKKRGLPLVLDFYMVPCVWCDKLEETTFRDPAVAKLVMEQFVPLRVDGTPGPDGDPRNPLAKILGIRSYPTIVFADSDGKILGTIEGYKDAAGFYEMLQRTLARVANPDWMVRDYKKAEEAYTAANYAASLALLRNILEDGRTRPVQEKARQLQNGIEKQAATRLVQARQLTDKGQTDEAVKALTDLVRLYPGTQEARDGGDMLTQMVQNPGIKGQQRERRARELLALAKEDYRTKQYLWCLDRCELLSASYGDLPEGVEAMQLASEIKGNTEWMQSAYDSLVERAANMQLSLADAWLKKGQPQQAIQCLERAAQFFPGSRQAEVAHVRISQIRGEPTRPVDFQKQ